MPKPAPSVVPAAQHNAFEFAMIFHGLWHVGDASFRAALEPIMRAYTRRHPTFVALLRQAAEVPVPDRLPPTTVRDTTTRLYALWQLADPLLRHDAQQLIRTYAYTHPQSVGILRSLLAEHEQIVHQRVRTGR